MNKINISRRIAVVTNYIPDYRYPVFEQLIRNSSGQYWFLTSSPLSQSCLKARENLRVKYSTTINLLNRTHHADVNVTQREYVPVPLGLFADLLRIKPDVVISGDFGLRSLVCWITAKISGALFIVWSEEIASSVRGRSWLQKKLRRFLAKRADACLAWGKPACSYLQSLGVSHENIFCCSQAIDNSHWMQLAARIDRQQARAQLNFSGVVFLLIGRMVERKGFRNFFQAWAIANKHIGVPVMAVIIGSGEQEMELKRMVTASGVRNVRFAGARSGDDLAQYYAAADVFVFPSLEDVWGMVVNEALCFGLPVLGSKHAGATQQLLAEPEIGRTFDPANIDEFSLILVELAMQSPPVDRNRAKTLLQTVTFDCSVNAIMSMLDKLGATTISTTLGLCMLYLEVHVPHVRRLAVNTAFAMLPHLPQLKRIVTNVILSTY